MHSINKTYYLLLLLCFACQSTEQPFDAIDQEIRSLETSADKKAYLEEVFKDDQQYRQGQSTQITQSYGKTSQKYQDFMLEYDRNDSLNLLKVERYIKAYGYPDIKQLGELAAQAPWAVIHHARDYDDRLRNFKNLYQAYQNGNIDGSSFSLFLERMYNYKFRQRFEIQGIYKEQEQIDSLIRLLDLHVE